MIDLLNSPVKFIDTIVNKRFEHQRIAIPSKKYIIIYLGIPLRVATGITFKILQFK